MVKRFTILYAKKTWTPLVFFVFTLIFCAISFVNHYLFRTSAFDLGINNNVLFDYAHFRWNNCMLMQPQFENILSDHLTLLPLLASPLVWIFGSYTMLVFQIAGILFGGWGLYRFIMYKTNNTAWAQLALIHFFSVWGIYSALAFDYHDNVMGAMFVPWIFLYFYKKDHLKLSFFVLLLLISKENMALWGVFIGAGLALLEYKNRTLLIKGLVISFLSAVYFILAIKLVIPSLANENRAYLHFHFSALGDNFEQAFVTVFTQPLYALKVLFVNHLNNPDGNFIKLELHVMAFLAGGYVFLWRPQYLIMLLPIYAQKMYNDDFQKWGLNAHYSIEFVPILSIALFLFLYEKKINIKWAMLAVAITFVSNMVSIEHRYSKWHHKPLFQFYHPDHYSAIYRPEKIYQGLKRIPTESKVSAHFALVPHLALRETIYQFPHVADADIIALLHDGRTYPMSEEEFSSALEKLKQDATWETIYEEDCLYIFKKDTSLLMH